MKHIQNSSLSLDEIANRIGKKTSAPLKWNESRNPNFRRIFSKELYDTEPLFRGNIKDKTNLSLVYTSPVKRVMGQYHPVIKIKTVEQPSGLRQIQITTGASLADKIRIVVFAGLITITILKAIFDFTKGYGAGGSIFILAVLTALSFHFRLKNIIEKEALNTIQEILKVNIPEPDSIPFKI